MHRLVPTLVDEMGEAYPELGRAQATIVETLRQEEERFRTTLGRGMALLEDATARPQGRRHAGGRDRLHPVRHLRLPAGPDPGRGAPARPVGRHRRLRRRPWPSSARAAREHWTGSGQTATAGEWLAIRDRLGPTVFTGYDGVEDSGEVLAILQGRRRRSMRPGRARPSEVLFDRTALLRRERRPGRRPRRVIEWPGGEARVTRRAEAGRRPARARRGDRRRARWPSASAAP